METPTPKPGFYPGRNRSAICHFVEFSGKVLQRHLTENQLARSTLPEALEEKHCVGMIQTRKLESNKDAKVSVCPSRMSAVKVSICPSRMSTLSKTGSFYLPESLGLGQC